MTQGPKEQACYVIEDPWEGKDIGEKWEMTGMLEDISHKEGPNYVPLQRPRSGGQK